MVRSRFSLVPFVGLLTFVSLSVAHAGRFSDVPAAHIHREAIERLADKGIVTGNPDGTFAPAKTVNRAEFLIMLYRAKGESPSGSAVCMRDVIAGSWYVGVVCDAVKRGYVGGYSDGTFKPQNPVNRAEAVKMLLMVLELPVGDYTDADRALINYPDVSLSAWYTKYLAASFRLGILPVAGQSASGFGPDAALSRAEAAAYIDSATRMREVNYSSSASVASSASAAPARSQRSEQSSSAIAVRSLSIPMTDTHIWPQNDPVLYRFMLSAKSIAEFTVTAPRQGRTVTCRLYKLGEDSIPTEYYIGSTDENRCFLRASMTAGNYQLELNGTDGETFTLSTRSVKGDGSDGNSEAKTLIKEQMRIGILEIDDSADFYTFKVEAQTLLFIDMSNSAHARCTIVPLNDVDMYGFTTPVCGESFLFPVGTYSVIIDRKPGILWGKEDYGVVLKSGQK